MEMTVNGVTHTYEGSDAYDCRSVCINNKTKYQFKTRKE